MPVQQFDADTLVVKEEYLIKQYEKEYENFYIPPQEIDTFDPEAMVFDSYIKSKDKVGFHHPVEVCIFEDDPYRMMENSEFRIHLRIIDGRHRWKQSIKNGVRWPVKFYRVTNYNQFMILRSHFDLKKDTNPNERMKFFEHLCKYYEIVLNIPKGQVCKQICNAYSPTPFHEATIRRYIPMQYKDMQKRKGNIASQNVRKQTSIAELLKKKPTQIRSDYARYKEELMRMQKENEYLRMQMGTSYFAGTRYIAEIKSGVRGNIWNFVKLFDNEKEATNFVVSSPETMRIIELNSIRETISSKENKRVVKVTTSFRSIHENNGDKIESKKIVLINRLMTSKHKGGIFCYKCQDKLILGQKCVSKSALKSTNHKYYCLPCARMVNII